MISPEIIEESTSGWPAGKFSTQSISVCPDKIDMAQCSKKWNLASTLARRNTKRYSKNAINIGFTKQGT